MMGFLRGSLAYDHFQIRNTIDKALIFPCLVQILRYLVFWQI